MFDLKRGEELQAIAREEVRQRAIIAALHEPVLITSLHGQVMDFNSVTASLFGDPARLYGRAIHELLPFLDGSPRREAGREIWDGCITDVTGREVDVEVTRLTLAAVRLPACNIYVVHDDSRHAELNRMRERLLYSVAHELRSPLAVLENSLEMLAREYADLSTRDFDRLLTTARRTSARLRALMEDLLSAGSIQSGRFVVRPSRADLSSVVDEAEEFVEQTIADKGQVIRRELPAEARWVLADRSYLRQVFTNLLSNASKYSPDEADIRVSAQRDEHWVRIIVADRGPGIPSDQRSGLFERFYRVRDGAGTGEPGVGLGLAICKGIVESHGGTIGVDSEIGAGTAIWFTLPSADSAKRNE